MYGQNKRKEEKEYGKKAVQLNNTSTEEEKDFEDLKRQTRELNELYKTKTKPQTIKQKRRGFLILSLVCKTVKTFAS